ncbi:hypothetical protein [Cerasicoccus arenae]|nr:hypothetical protein [Cerasicoccus arenae]
MNPMPGVGGGGGGGGGGGICAITRLSMQGGRRRSIREMCLEGV